MSSMGSELETFNASNDGRIYCGGEIRKQHHKPYIRKRLILVLENVDPTPHAFNKVFGVAS